MQPQSFIVDIACPEGTDPYRAYDFFIQAAEHYEHIAAGCGGREFKMALRAADESEGEFIDRQLLASNEYQEIWCLKNAKGYTFFGLV